MPVNATFGSIFHTGILTVANTAGKCHRPTLQQGHVCIRFNYWYTILELSCISVQKIYKLIEFAYKLTW